LIAAIAAALAIVPALPVGASGAARPIIVGLVIVIGEQCRLVVIDLVGFDDVIEPFANRHAGSPRGRSRSLARVGA
jgi:hypothetical protein